MQVTKGQCIFICPKISLLLLSLHLLTCGLHKGLPAVPDCQAKDKPAPTRAEGGKLRAGSRIRLPTGARATEVSSLNCLAATAVLDSSASGRRS